MARVVNKTTPTYVHSDHLGSPVARSDTGGTVLPREHYTPFGITLNNAADLDDQADFTGHIKDSATGLNSMQARYYDPIIGRFLSVDPVTFMDTSDPRYFNRYAYSANDPINNIDPSGGQFAPINVHPGQADAQYRADKAAIAGIGTAVRSQYRGVKQEARRRIVAPLSESTRNAVQREDAVIGQAMKELATNPEARSELADAASEYISDNPNRVRGRVMGTVATNAAVAVATRGAGKAETVKDIAKARVTGGLKGAALTAFATSGDVRQAAQDGVTDAEGFMKAFVGGESGQCTDRESGC